MIGLLDYDSSSEQAGKYGLDCKIFTMHTEWKRRMKNFINLLSNETMTPEQKEATEIFHNALISLKDNMKERWLNVQIWYMSSNPDAWFKWIIYWVVNSWATITEMYLFWKYIQDMTSLDSENILT